MAHEISLNNIGPIDEFSYELNGPGLHILRGRQGAGKTTILRTVQLAVDGRSDDGDPRLVLATDRSENEAFDELSDGERWPVILAVAAASNRLIVLPQSAFGELAPSTREALDAMAAERDCYVLTAIADDCDLHGERYAEFARTAHTEAAE